MVSPLAIASGEIKRKLGGIEGLPTTMLYDRQGILRVKVVGFEYTDKIEAALKPLLWRARSLELLHLWTFDPRSNKLVLRHPRNP
jgi:hypothetical protein